MPERSQSIRCLVALFYWLKAAIKMRGGEACGFGEAKQSKREKETEKKREKIETESERGERDR